MKKRFSYIIYILIVFLIFILISFLIHNNLEKKYMEEQDKKISRPLKNIEKGNSIVTNIWLYEESRLDNLIEHNIKYLFVEIGDIEQNGKIKSKKEIIKFLNFIEEYEKKNNYNFIMLSYSEINTYQYNISSEFKENFVENCNDLVSLGFDGVHIDIEPVRLEQKQIYLNLLEALAKEFPKDKILSVYSGAVSFGILHTNEWEWTLDFYKKVSNNVDLIFVPGYDLGLKNKKDYQKFMQKQIEELSLEKLNSHLILGIPTHKQEPETIDNVLEAYNLAKNSENYFIGVSIFAEWTVDEYEWDVFENYFF